MYSHTSSGNTLESGMHRARFLIFGYPSSCPSQEPPLQTPISPGVIGGPTSLTNPISLACSSETHTTTLNLECDHHLIIIIILSMTTITYAQVSIIAPFVCFAARNLLYTSNAMAEWLVGCF